MSITCSKCRGLGWVYPMGYRPNGWCEVCPICGGAGRFTARGLAKLLGESSSTMRRFLADKPMRAKTLLGLIDKLLVLT